MSVRQLLVGHGCVGQVRHQSFEHTFFIALSYWQLSVVHAFQISSIVNEGVSHKWLNVLLIPSIPVAMSMFSKCVSVYECIMSLVPYTIFP